MLHKSRQVLQDNIYEKQEKIYSLKRSKDSITILKKDITLLENSLKDKYANNKTKIQTFNEFQKVENDKNILETQINRNKEKIKQQFPQKVAKHLQDKTYNLPKTDALLRYCAEIKDFVAVDSLETALLAYRKLCTSVIDDKEYKAILSRKYDKKVVENALIKLSNTTSDNQEQIAYYTNLLQNYCKMNKIVVFIAQGIKSNLPDYPADAKKSLHDFLKEHGERLKPYLYLMNELSQKQKNISYDMNVTETPCK
jgi:hypothetical protein